MFREPLPRKFYKFKEIGLLKIIDNNIILEGKNFDSANNIYGLVFAISYTFPSLIIIAILSINIIFKNNFGNEFFKFFMQDKDMFSAITLIWIIANIFIYSFCIKLDTALDLENKNIYTLVNIFDLIVIKCNKICIEDIAEIGNSVTFYQGKRGGTEDVPIHPITKRCHVYLISILLKNGKIHNIPIGSTINSYYNSMDLAEAISELWGIPLITCNDNYRLVLDKEEANKGNYLFAMEEIKDISLKIKAKKFFKALAIVFLAGFILFIFTYIVATAKTKQGLTIERVERDIKSLFGINTRKSRRK